MQPCLPRLFPTPQGIALAGVILAKRHTGGTFAVNRREKQIHAQLQAAYGRPVPPYVIDYIKRGCEILAQVSDEALENAAYPFFPNPHANAHDVNEVSLIAEGLMRFALTGLNDMDDMPQGKARLLKMQAAVHKDRLLKSYGLPTWEDLAKDDSADEEDGGCDDSSGDSGASDSGDSLAGGGGYNPGEPRIPAGQPGGGQWTTGEDTPENNELHSNKNQTLTYDTVGGGQDMASWSIQWRLSQPSPNGGIIVQEVIGHSSVSDGQETVSRSYHYWEGWVIPPGSRVTQAPVNSNGQKEDDSFYNANSAEAYHSGSDYSTTIAIFYEGMSLPPTFIPRNKATFGGAAPSTIINPNLPANLGTPPVVRTWSLKF